MWIKKRHGDSQMGSSSLWFWIQSSLLPGALIATFHRSIIDPLSKSRLMVTCKHLLQRICWGVSSLKDYMIQDAGWGDLSSGSGGKRDSRELLHRLLLPLSVRCSFQSYCNRDFKFTGKRHSSLMVWDTNQNPLKTVLRNTVLIYRCIVNYWPRNIILKCRWFYLQTLDGKHGKSGAKISLLSTSRECHVAVASLINSCCD